MPRISKHGRGRLGACHVRAFKQMYSIRAVNVAPPSTPPHSTPQITTPTAMAVDQIDAITSTILAELDKFHTEIVSTGRPGRILQTWRESINERKASLAAF
jgi:hypothetical protein